MSLTSSGLTIKRLADIRSEMRTAARAAFGEAIQTGDNTPMGRFIDVLATREADVWLMAQALYDALDIASAEGVILDNLANYVGVSREPARASTVTLTLSGDPLTVIPAGSLFKVANGPTFASDTEVTLDGGGAATVAATATATGPLDADPGDVDVIVNPISGLDTVTNAAAAVPGRDVESDQELRASIARNRRAIGAASDAALQGSIEDLDFIDQCVVVSNRTDVVDANGIPAHSVRCVVYPNPAPGYPTVTDDHLDLIELIYQKAPSGIGIDGTQEGTVTTQYGQSLTMRYSPAAEQDVYLALTLTKIAADYPADGDDQVKAAVAAYIEALPINGDVYLARVSAAAVSVAGVIGCAVLAKIGSAPGGGDTADLTITLSQKAKCDVANVSIS